MDLTARCGSFPPLFFSGFLSAVAPPLFDFSSPAPAIAFLDLQAPPFQVLGVIANLDRFLPALLAGISLNSPYFSLPFFSGRAAFHLNYALIPPSAPRGALLLVAPPSVVVPLFIAG